MHPLSLTSPPARELSVACAFEHASPGSIPCFTASPHMDLAFDASEQSSPVHEQVQRELPELEGVDHEPLHAVHHLVVEGAHCEQQPRAACE